MQSWSGAGQNGANDGHNSWQSGFTYANQNNQFDPNQPWSQPGSEQATYSHLNAQDPAASNFFEASHQGNAYLAGGLHSAASSQAPFHAGHGALALNQQYSQPSQDVLDPAFNNIHPDLYGHQPKVNLGGDGIGHLGQVQSHPHAHSQGFTQHEFQFAPQNEQLYDAPVAYNQPQQVPQPGRQDSHTPVQHFDNLHAGFPQGHRFGQQPPQQAQVQQHQQQPYRPGQTFSPTIGGGQGDQYQLNNNLAYQQPSQQFNAQQGYAPPKPNAYTTPPQGTPVQLVPQPLQQSSVPSTSHPTLGVNPSATPGAQYGAVQQQQVNAGAIPTSSAMPSAIPPVATQPADTPKKRKRATKSAPEPVVPEQPAYPVDLPVDLPRRGEDSEVFTVPVPTDEEAQLIAQFAKRNKAAQIKYPSIKGLPHLVYDGTIKIPAPKSYDKLSPCIALPPHDRPIIPELGYLPCEIQGKFTTQYRPSAEKGGLDERRDEAKLLLDDFDRSMHALGKRRPKYTEYPHAFKEQLKSDEASKNKAEKKAKKEQEDDKAKPIRAPVRPTDPAEAAAWDAIGIVHIEPSVARTNALIAGRVQQAGEFFIKLRGEMNKAKLDVDNAVKNKAPDSELAELKAEAEQKKEAFYRALDVTIEHADDSVLDNLGGHQKLVLSLVNAMISSIKAGDFSGKLPKALLEIFTHFRMTRKIAETTNFETVRKRFEDKGDDEVKEMAREIGANMRKVVKAAESETATGYTGTSAASRAKAGIKPSTEAPSTKRGRDDDSDSRTVKKIAVEPGNSSLSKKLAQPKIHPPTTSKIIPPKAAPSILPGKARPIAKPAIKAEADSPSASGDDKSKAADTKKSATKAEAGKPVVPKVEAKPPAASKASSAPGSSALSGIASLLDSINAPKAPEALVATARETRESDTPEAPEEKAKRLRKEARRKLRVSWKPEADLVQIRIFHKDDDEDEGREGNMIRDAADDRSEGMVLKQRADVEDDDDDDDIPYQPWLGPVEMDFSVLPDDVRSKNYVTRGGTVTFSTDEQQRIAEREQRELMAIYTDVDDIPATPKSPLPETATMNTEAKAVYLPRDDARFEEIQLRWRDEQQYGLDEALRSAMKRLDAKHSPSSKLDSILGRLQGGVSTSASSSQPASSMQNQHSYSTLPLLFGAAAETQLLAVLASDKTKAWRDPNPAHYGDTVRAYNYTDPTVRMNGNAVEEVAKSLIGKPFPPTSPPDWLLFDQERVREWRFGYNKELASKQKKEEEAQARAEAEANALKMAAAAAAAAAAVNPASNNHTQDWAAQYAQQQPNIAPYMALLQQMTGGQLPSAAAAPAPAQHPQIPDGQLQSILAAINQPQQAAPVQAPNMASYLNPNDASYQQLVMLTQMAQGQQPPPPPPPPPSFGHGPERDWDRNDNNNNNNNNNNQRGGEHGKEGRKKKGTLPPHKPANKALIGTKPCTFWQQGKCARGDKCTFRHG